VDLTPTEERLWSESFSHACRKNIKRAMKEGVRIYQASGSDDIEKFHRIYLATMDRRCATSKYYFPLSYFMDLFEQLPGNAAFVLAEYNDRIVAATLYLHDDTDVYSYLGGADERFQHLRPTNVVIYETIRWAQSLGKKRLILGGGYQPDDGIFRFKASFSPLRASFQVYRHVQLAEEYDTLCRKWSAHYDRDLASSGEYFPAYRSIPNGL
jgi:lipid II:glycine glycyltransferase (peptidoglycan interpeptide bridge formation enzyme)